MKKNIIFFILFFYLLILIQTSFLVHFKLFGIVFNIVLIAVIFINLFVPRLKLWGFAAAFIGGFFLDIFSNNFIGCYILICLAIALFIKFILKKHVQIPFIQRP